MPVEPSKVVEVAALAASSLSMSVAPTPMLSARLPVLVTVPVISSVPPLAVTLAAPLAETAAVTLPWPAIAPVVRNRAVGQRRVAPSSLSVFAPMASALVSVSEPAVLISSVPVVPAKEAEVAALAASSSSLSEAPEPMPSARVPVLVIAPVTSSVPPVAVICAAPLAETAAETLPWPVIVPLVRAQRRRDRRAALCWRWL